MTTEAPSSETLIVTDHEGICTIEVNRPERKNALDLETMSALCAAIEGCAERAEGGAGEPLLGVIVSGRGGGFISGGDLQELHKLKAAGEAEAMSARMQRCLSLLEALPCPVVAAIEGHAVGGGAELALAADFRLLSRSGSLRFPQRSLGLSTGWGASARLSRLLGPDRAFALLALGEPVRAEEALRLGLVTRLTAPGGALEEARRLLEGLSQEPEATRALKQLTRGAAAVSEERLATERALFAALWISPTHWERVEQWKHQARARKLRGAGGAEQEVARQPLVGEGRRGIFIALEGLDGAGTTTQAARLVGWLQAQGRMAHQSAEPSEGAIGQLTRTLLSGERRGLLGRPIPKESLALLFAADRADHYHNEIAPLLSEGVDVISDRYRVSSLAYQGAELEPRWVAELNAPFPRPDLTIYLKVSVETAAERRHKRGAEADHYEEDRFLQRVYERYDALQESEQLIIIDGEQSSDRVEQACREAIRRWLDGALAAEATALPPTAHTPGVSEAP